MKATYFFCCLMSVCLANAALCQSVYHFKYNFHQPEDSIGYDAFFVRYDDGSGLLRVRYLLPATGEIVLVEADVEESYPGDTLAAGNSNGPLVLRTINPRFIIGNNSIRFNPPFFQFAYNAASGFHEPAGVTAVEKTVAMSPSTSFTAELLTNGGLNKTLVSAFFSEDEDFYTNLFRPGTKGLTATEKNTRLYLLIVADTLDKEIGAACKLDIARTLQTFKGLTDTLGIKFLAKTIAGTDYSKKNVELAISNFLKPAPSDIVIFYYSGHGFRKQEENRRFPYIKLKTNHTSKQDVYANSINIEDVFASIVKKPSRLNLVLSDCCNSDIEITNSTGSKPGKTKGSGVKWNEDNYRSLFLNKTRMSVLATAADNGQRACSKNDFGSFFSFFLTTSMENYCSNLKSKVNWDLVLQDTKTQTIYKAKHTYCDKPYIPENICNQYPYYKIVYGSGNE
ncbi:MAG: caspase family protein [Chitinophagaceae bacterium]